MRTHTNRHEPRHTRARERSRNAHPHNSQQTTQTATNQQHATEQDTADKQTAARAHRDARTDTQVTHNNIPTTPKRRARARKRPAKNKETPQPRLTGTATGASRHRIRNQRHHAQQPHPTQGVFPSRAQCANHGPATGEREPPEHTTTRECAHPDNAESRPDVAETRKR